MNRPPKDEEREERISMEIIVDAYPLLLFILFILPNAERRKWK
jgi:hypothetical protein